ncbi:efflux RND transporter periplasmic adaptor subunit [Telmatospirillum siberiense]|uniref:Efflux transporter periplasmic adaptor subunit n=1 Tax=Telmatospirillum siberiense TaxID=382514 RepID=A0A2N3PT22_9PROT|nr:efflux RND transporter periplasmic adaptor subunit [Telmatospirillum siberiense]PKU23553.1 efflux transporter periplasmic adaptor subunit [Telmatospirillum siberiense]
MKTRIYFRSRLLLTSAIVAAVIGVGVYSAQSTGASPGTAAGSPAVPVVVRTLAEQKIRAWSEFSGRLHAVDSAEIRPEVGGRIIALKFEDGQNVKAGDVLFIIDPRPYEAAVAKAEANLASARTNAAFAKLELDRAHGLQETQAIAQRVYDERANAARVANADVQAAEATLKQASLDLEHAYVRAPIAGRASRAEITLGNLVQAGPGAPLLTTVVGNQSIYADFDVDEQTYMQSVRDYASGRDQERRIPVQLSVQGDKGHLYQGTIDSFDNRLDPASGTIRARAKFDNADGALVPGMFVSVKLANGGESSELLIPARALGFDQSKKFVYVVEGDNKVAYREVELGKQIASERVALKGVQAGDRVIVDGVQHVRPNALVDPKEAAPDSGSAQAGTN